MDVTPGIWHEVGRNRWRVKLCKDGEIYHRSYHHSYQSALKAWTQAKQMAARPVSEVIAEQRMTPIAKFLRQPLPRELAESHLLAITVRGRPLSS